ncbi:MAG: DMT family transporter [Bacteroides sp.]|nr:DMT family transporter [Bacteroides sp.]
MKNFKYIAMVLLGGALYGTLSSFVKLSYSYGFHAAEIAFSQALLAALFLGIYALFTSRKKPTKKLTRKDWVSLLLTGSAIGLTNYFYYYSVYFISASLAIILLMQFTWFSLLIEWVCFRKKPSPLEVVTVFFILAGTLLAGNLWSAQTLSFSVQGILLGLAASVSYAIYIVANSRTGKSVRWQTKSTLIMTGSALTIFLVNTGTIINDHHFGGIFFKWALFLAILGTTIPTALFAAGIPKVGAGVSSILMTIELPVAVLCAHFIVNEPVTLPQIAGVVVMLGAIATMNYYRSRTS